MASPTKTHSAQTKNKSENKSLNGCKKPSKTQRNLPKFHEKSHFYVWVQPPFSHGFRLVFPWLKPVVSEGKLPIGTPTGPGKHQVWEVRARRQSSSQTLAKTYDAHRWERFSRGLGILMGFKWVLMGFNGIFNGICMTILGF